MHPFARSKVQKKFIALISQKSQASEEKNLINVNVHFIFIVQSNLSNIDIDDESACEKDIKG